MQDEHMYSSEPGYTYTYDREMLEEMQGEWFDKEKFIHLDELADMMHMEVRLTACEMFAFIET